MSMMQASLNVGTHRWARLENTTAGSADRTRYRNFVAMSTDRVRMFADGAVSGQLRKDECMCDPGVMVTVSCPVVSEALSTCKRDVTRVFRAGCDPTEADATAALPAPPQLYGDPACIA